jgi:hypothetical protein
METATFRAPSVEEDPNGSALDNSKRSDDLEQNLPERELSAPVQKST